MRDRSLLICTVFVATVGRRRCCFAGWVDPDTPEEFHTTTANYHNDKREYDLVFSDEFEQDGRSFEDGADPRWTAIDKNDCEFVATTTCKLHLALCLIYFPPHKFLFHERRYK